MHKNFIAFAVLAIFLAACSPAAEQYQDDYNSNPSADQPQGETSSSSNNSGSAGGSTTTSSASSICPEILDKFNQLKMGMPYEEAVFILGAEGELLNRNPTALGEPSAAYKWNFTVPCVASLHARFTNNVLDGFGFGQSDW
jgi:hypothetical protein